MDRRKRREPSRSRSVAAATAREDGAAPPSRDEVARAELAPLAPGERPPALLVAIAVTSLLGLVNAIAYGAGATIAGKHPGPGVLAFTALMALLAGGMWMRRYLAVLAFEALLALVALLFTLYLIEANSVRALIECVVVIVAAGAMFWKLVRVMGRMASPRPANPQSPSP